MGFEWPGRLAHLKYELARGQVAERREAVRRLGAYPTESVREPLLTALEDDDAQVRKEAAGAVARAQVKEAAPLLAAWLADRDPEVRAAAVTALGELAEPSSREALTRALTDALPAVREAAAGALAKVADEEALLALQTATADADPSVREAALTALRGRADGRALPALTGRIHDDSPAVRAALMETLGALHDARALPLLVRAAETERDEVELAAVMALGELGEHADVAAASLVPSLRKKLDSEPRVAKAAVAAVGRTPGAAALALLLDSLDDPELALAAKSALVERVRRSAGTPRGEAERPQLLAALGERLARPERSTYAEAPNLIADSIVEWADVLPSATLHPSLLAALQAGRGDAARLTRALAYTGAPDALVPLLERMTRLHDGAPADDAPAAPVLSPPATAATPPPTAAASAAVPPGPSPAVDPARELHDLLDALLAYFGAGLADGRATDPLLAQLARAQRDTTRIKLIELVGRTRAPRALAALHAELARPTLAVQLAALAAIGEIGATESLTIVQPLLAAANPELRVAAARAYGELAREAEVLELVRVLDGEVAADRAAVLTAAGIALGRLRSANQLSAPAEKTALAALTRWLGSADLSLSAHALDALRRFGHPAAARAIARELLSTKLSRRAAATNALADFPGDETRRLLRFVLQRSAPRAGVSAVLALGEVGDQRDVAALLRVARHAHWPLPAAATFAVRRIVEREDVKKKTLERSLCELTGLTDPYARANVAAALAALGGATCPGVDLAAWYASGEPSVVRSAAARWLRARAAAGETEPSLTKLLATCSGDPDPLVRASCSPAASSGGGRALDVIARSGDGERLMSQRLIALRLPDASVYVGFTDANARVLVSRAPAGPVVLEDPGE